MSTTTTDGDHADRAPSQTPRSQPSVTTTVTVTVLVMALLAAAVAFGLLWNSQREELDRRNAANADRMHAEKVAADYAVATSTFDYRDLGPWRVALTTGVSPELKAKLEASVGAISQLMQPLQWVSKGTLLDSVTRSQAGEVYVVAVYISTQTSTVQSPNQEPKPASFTITLDKGKDWQLTEVGSDLQPVGGGAATPPR
ncbi:Mce-associated membrane protein OS=Tsukamurella paurometabola (strain ATCC 8368 / DSM / CCUG 35730 / CIP 100753 / JCM 10117 / KCTC 9821 / NBRC 16120 / NCIMB 702349 / NCTC 13040) OX=521096 GN=Tpau_1086 PE=4 SV=1 [Tsukamurella paurometabola]|uniref:Mce-associated membrane protein n=1 Tax=Tsukamurella paurometabola (strain ATCC 8368 / DSM 20162 / CCUG 35730 / CIP 100753 / JCM 10117 / KCTC 9821 / NBRC 16120 / NCIMB 702349 / NCTC 13040) TaxID=521096 RepID=D5UVC8_TSUPD|nr:hypothetical protein [Tsukamurella paurometabola]ADG77718.1 conserved hypothetical protein [Tsukamurella paurometabola DSM 20162]SUP28459.1 Uncharacterised protein [Tsukamurella paurometabola]